MLKRLLLPLLLLFVASMAHATLENLLPRPRSVQPTSEQFVIGTTMALTDPTHCLFLTQFLEEQGVRVDENAPQRLVVEIVSEIPGTRDYAVEGLPAEAYTLRVSSQEVRITALNATGVIRAASTLLQLAQGCNGTLQGVEITDYPSFKLRGYLLDIGRSFISVEEVKHEIDLLTRFKINYFHWHLTENQAWRMESKKYPQLTSTASMTRHEGKYYTQEQIRDVVAYAKERGMLVVPEIDMPGHSEAFTRAMGFSMQTAQGVEVLKNVLEEVAELFPESPYIHIGADEQNISYPNFIQTMCQKIHALGKKVITWNPISGVTISTATGIDVTQMWSTSGKKVEGLANMDSKYNYANLHDVFADLVGIYRSNLFYEQEGSPAMVGGVACVWTDRILPQESDYINANNFWALMLANAERCWEGGRTQYIEECGAVLPNEGEEYEKFADWERRFLHYKATWLAQEPIPYVKQTNIRWRLTDAFPNGGSPNAVLAPETEGLKQKYDVNGTPFYTQLVTGGTIYLRHAWGAEFVPGVYASPAINSTAYAWTYVWSPEEQDAGALIEFQTYERSWHDTTAPAGQWDRKGSRIFLNDVELVAPQWKRANQTATFETLLLDENFTGRAPYPIHLKKGWNKVFLKLPYNNPSGIRLNRWMWTFVITDVEGNNALEGLIYSPDQITDAAAQALSLYVDEVRAGVHQKVSDRLGFFSLASATEVLALIEQIEATLQEEWSESRRAEQRAALEAAYAYFLAHYEEGGINMPQESTTEREVWYTLCTPLRDGRYLASNGTATNITGVAAVNANATWKFVRRADNTYNIVNYDGNFISPASSNNTALKCQRTEPSAGWTLSLADAQGYFIITSGTVQMNQTTSGLNYALYNWGYNTTAFPGEFHKSDQGCKFVIAPAPKALVLVTNIQPSTTTEEHYYYMYTPGRESRYATSEGVDATLKGLTAPTLASAWKFVRRADATFDIENYHGGFISADVASNSPIKLTSTPSSKGWTLRPVSSTSKYFILTAGEDVELNQTKVSQNYDLYNWGYNSPQSPGAFNFTDTGCQYAFVEADVPTPSALIPQIPSVLPGAETYYTPAGLHVVRPQSAGVYIQQKGGVTRKVYIK